MSPLFCFMHERPSSPKNLPPVPTPETTPDPAEVKRVVEMIRKGEIPETVEDAIVRTPEVQKAAANECLSLLNDSFIGDSWPLYNEEVDTQEYMTTIHLSRIRQAAVLFKKMSLPATLCKTPEFTAFLEMMATALADRSRDTEFVFMDESPSTEGGIDERDFLTAFPFEFSSLSKDAQRKIMGLLVFELAHSEAGDAFKIAQAFHIPQKIYQDAALQEIVSQLNMEAFTHASDIADLFSIPPDALRSPEVQSAVQQWIMSEIWEGRGGDTLALARKFQVPADFFHTPAVMSEAIGAYIFYLDLHKEKFFEETNFNGLDITTERLLADDRFAFQKDERIPLVFRKEMDAYHDMSPAARRSRVTHAIAPNVYITMEKACPDALVPDKQGKVDWARVAEENLDLGFVSGPSVSNAYKMAVGTFGPETTLRYANCPGLNAHDAFHFFETFVTSLKKNTISPGTARSLLLEIAKDRSAYAEGTAHHRFAAITYHLETTKVTDMLARARTYGNVESLAKLVAEFEAESGSVFSSWKRLKKFDELQQMLTRSDLFGRLKHESDPAMRAYVEKLAFHPNIDGGKVIEFWENPVAFLKADDKHTSKAVNMAKKPSNYLSLPFLGLKGADLRDALVHGELDALQTLPPMEREYELFPRPEDDYKKNPKVLARFVREALGQSRKGIPGQAASVTKVFHALKNALVVHGMKLEILSDPEKGAALLRSLSPETKNAIERAVFDPVFGMAAPEGKIYRVILGKKSDPDMVVAGNDTASCMPFGSGKNNVYMFNPNCAQLVVQRKTEEGNWRTAAQSVMTLDVETGRPTPELVAAYKSSVGCLHDLVDEKALTSRPVVTCDNIQVAKNEEGNAPALIRDAYHRFFTEYLAEHAARLGVDPTRVAVGTGYTPSELGLRTVPNTFVPLAPMGYSDNVHPTAFLLETGLPNKETKPNTGTAPMTVRDTLAVAALEGKDYHDNVTALENLHGMQNNIIGMEIANRHFGRPNLSFVHRSDKGLPQGYVFAYEGENHGRPEIYVSDLAADPKSTLAGGRLVQRFFDAYVSNYGTDVKPFLPIFANARDQTSFKLLSRQVERLAEKSKLVAEMVEIGRHKRGGDVFRDVRIFIAKTPEDLARQKAAYAE